MATANAKKQKVKSVPKTREVQYTKGLDNLPSFYVNNTSAMVSNFDVKLTFGQLSEASEEKLVVDPQLVLFMSPQHAKAVVDLLATQLKAYEATHGPIPQAKSKSSPSA
jgi:hypothetical protein